MSEEVTSRLHDIDEVTKKASVSIPALRVKREVDSELSSLSKTVKLDGFRPGKAPRQMIEKLHGERLRLEVSQRLISSTLQDLVKSNSLEMVGYPDIQDLKLEAGKDIAFDATISLLPKPAITNYDSFQVKVVARDVTEKEIEEVLTRLRESKATLKPLAFRNTVAAQDAVEASIIVEIEGDEPGRPEPVTLVLGQGGHPKELEEGLIGATVGETRAVESVLPSDHPNEKLRGKKTTYRVTINGLAERVLPELDDNFIKTLGLGVETLLELRLKVRTQLEEEHKREEKADIQTAVLDQLISAHSFKVPQPMIDDEIRNLLVRYGVVDPQKVDLSQISVEPFREKLGEAALKRIKTAIIVDRIGEHEKIAPNEAEINAALQDIATKNNVSIEQVRQYVLRSERALSFSLELTRNKVLEFLATKATVERTAPVAEEKK